MLHDHGPEQLQIVAAGSLVKPNRDQVLFTQFQFDCDLLQSGVNRLRLGLSAGQQVIGRLPFPGRRQPVDMADGRQDRRRAAKGLAR